MELDLTEAVEAFKAAWEAADKRGESGHRTEAGMAAAAPLIAAQVRAQVAGEIEADGHAAFCLAFPPDDTGSCPCGLEDHARIARGSA